MEYFVYIFVGFISGMTAGLFGMGGGTIIVPIMSIFGLPIYHAIGLSIMQMIFSSIFGSMINYAKKLLVLKDALYIGLGGFLGASLSGIVLYLLNATTIHVLFLALTLVSFYRFAFNVKATISTDPPIKKELYRNAILILAGIITGVFAISLGIGGGLLIAPILGYYLGLDSKKVVPLSLFFVICSSVSGTLSFLYHNIIDIKTLQIGLYIGFSSLFGVAFGISILDKISPKTHKFILLCVYTFASVSMIIKLFF